MSKLVGSTGQYTGSEYLYDASGTTGSGATLVLPKAKSRSSLIIQNVSDTNMFIEIGGARASASLTNGAVSSVSVTNAGFNYTLPPLVIFLGGGYQNPTQITPIYSLTGLPDWPAPSRPAKATCVMTGSPGALSIASISIDDPGAGYAYQPYVFLMNNPNDPFGCAVPSTGVGIELISAGGSYTSNGTICTTDQVGIYCASSGKAYTCKFSV